MSKDNRYNVSLSPKLEEMLKTLRKDSPSNSAIFRDGIGTLYTLQFEVPKDVELGYRKQDGTFIALRILYSGGVIKPQGPIE